jgi:hypothetical protein
MASTIASARSCPCAMLMKGLRLVATPEGLCSFCSLLFRGLDFSKPSGEIESRRISKRKRPQGTPEVASPRAVTLRGV